jgi:hypothetical protein
MSPERALKKSYQPVFCICAGAIMLFTEVASGTVSLVSGVATPESSKSPNNDYVLLELVTTVAVSAPV